MADNAITTGYVVVISVRTSHAAQMKVKIEEIKQMAASD
jgi:hypothetical protein